MSVDCIQVPFQSVLVIYYLFTASVLASISTRPLSVRKSVPSTS